MIRPEPTIKKDQGKIADDLFEARLRRREAEKASRLPDDVVDNMVEIYQQDLPKPTAPITMGGDPFKDAESMVKYGLPKVFVQGTGGSRSAATPTIDRLVGQPKKMSKTKKALIGAAIASPAAIVGSAYLGDDEDSKSPDLPKGFTQDDYEKYLKAAEEAAAQARKAAAGQ